MRWAPALALLLLAGCGAGAETAQAGADAERQRPLPCSVVAHGMGAVQGALEGRPAATDCDSSIDPQTIPLDELIRVIPDQHPAFYYILAGRLFEAGRRDDAVFWLYAGQLRYRIRLACHPDLPPDMEPALFGALHNEVGLRINEYGGGDPDAWAAAMERALAWDEATRNGFEPRAPCRAAIAEQRRGLGELLAHVRATKEQIRAERASRGLPNR